MKAKPRWMKSVIATAKAEAKTLPAIKSKAAPVKDVRVSIKA